jgi:hypothetical protein
MKCRTNRWYIIKYKFIWPVCRSVVVPCVVLPSWVHIIQCIVLVVSAILTTFCFLAGNIYILMTFWSTQNLQNEKHSSDFEGRLYNSQDQTSMTVIRLKCCGSVFCRPHGGCLVFQRPHIKYGYTARLMLYIPILYSKTDPRRCLKESPEGGGLNLSHCSAALNFVD